MSELAKTVYQTLHSYILEYFPTHYEYPLSRRLHQRIMSYAQPCIRIKSNRLEKTPIELGISRYGGIADLPTGTPYPISHGEQMDLVAQINLADVSPYDASGLLPESGLLSFFMPSGDHIDDAKVIYTQDLTTLGRATLPANKKSFSCSNLSFETWISFPEHSSKIGREMLEVPDGEWWNNTMANYSDWILSTPFSHHMMGYPSTVHGYTFENALDDNRRAIKEIAVEDTKDCIRLFQYAIDEQESTNWNDLDFTFVWVMKRDDLENKAFDKAMFHYEYGD